MPTNYNQTITADFCQDKLHVENLIYVKNIDSFCLYQEECGYYKIMDSEEFDEYVFNYLREKVPKNLTGATIRDIAGLIKWMVYRKLPDMDSHYVAFEDKLLNLHSFEFEEFDRMKPAFHKIACKSTDVQDMNETPMFQKFLSEILVDGEMCTDNELLTVVQEMFGYYFLNTLEGHSMFFLTGEGSNGKSVLLNILRAVIGERFTSAMSIETITTNRFAASGLVGKKINICSEDESQYIKSDRFKALVSGDPIQVERKFGNSFMMYPTTKYIFATNNSPTFNSVDFGLLRRVNIIPFLRRIKDGEKDTMLDKKIIGAELPGIIRWLIEGAKRLVANKYQFSPSRQMVEMKEQFQQNLSAAIMFARETYLEAETDEGGQFISNSELYYEFRAWCERTGRKPSGMTKFLNEVASIFIKKTDTAYSNEERKTVRGRFLKRREI